MGRCNAPVTWTKSHSAPIAPAMVRVAHKTVRSRLRPGSGPTSHPPSPPRLSSRRLGQLALLSAGSDRRTAFTPTVSHDASGQSSVTTTDSRGKLPGGRPHPLRPQTRQNRSFYPKFAQGRIDVFDSAFHQVKTARWQFRDPRLPRGYLPFNTQTLNGDIFVAYDKADPVTHRQAVGRGLGVVDEFSPDGHLISRITSGGALNAPWGLAIAPAGWGHAAGSLLVGNFGDGRINILAKQGNHFAHRVTGLVRDISTGKPFAEPGLSGLLPGTATNGGTDALWFTAGLNHEQNGLLGVLRP